MKKLVLFITLLLGLASCTSKVESSFSFYQSAVSSESSSIQLSTTQVSEESGLTVHEPYKTDTDRIINDTAVAIWGEDIPEDAFKAPDADGVVELNHELTWQTAISPTDENSLSFVLLEFISLEKFPEYLLIGQPPLPDTVDNLDVSVMFMVTSNWLHVMCIYDYYINGEFNIMFMAGPYKAFI